MKTRTFLVLVMALLAIAAAFFAQGCSTTEQPVQPVPAPSMDERSVSDNATVTTKGEVQSTALASWNSLSAMGKRQLLLETAYSDYLARRGAKTSYTCKTWAQFIVPKASGGSAWLPKNCPNGYGYYYCPLDHVTQILQNQSAPYTHFLPGRILQMWYGGQNKPHTAFIFSVSPSGMQWLDCNWVGGVGNGIVGIHSISWSDFYRNVVNYTLYEVY